MNLKKELMNFLQSLDGDELRNLADGSLPEEMAVDAYIASNHVPDVGKTIDEKVERFEKVYVNGAYVASEWIRSLKYQIDQLGNGYAEITVFESDKDLFIHIMEQFTPQT